MDTKGLGSSGSDADQIIDDIACPSSIARGIELTKRNVVSTVQSVSPIVKAFYQVPCERKDDPLREELVQEWQKLVQGLLEGQTMSMK
jgi:hypothetical protein